MDIYHKAARDGYIDTLKEATKKDLNSKDEDGMTPTLWASFEGNIDALRTIVGRGGDPDKADNYGNTALHFASARGHMNCVTFLVSFGVNMWALDIDYHTPKDLAAINNKEEILRFLDAAIGKKESKPDEKKKIKAMKEKAMKDAEKRVKEFDKLQKKAAKYIEEEEKKRIKKQKEMEKHGHVNNSSNVNNDNNGRKLSVINPPTFSSMRHRDSRLLYGQSPKFSEIVAHSKETHNKVFGTSHGNKGAVLRKLKGKRNGTTTTSKTGSGSDDFKVAEVSHAPGQRTCRSLSGLRRDSEVMFVPKYDVSNSNRKKLSGLFEDEETDSIKSTSISERKMSKVGMRAGSISVGMARSFSQPNYLNEIGEEEKDKPFADDSNIPHNIPSIFDRPGFGSVAFRSSLGATMSHFTNGIDNNRDSSIGSAGSLKDGGEGSNDYEDAEMGAVELFLAAAGLTKYISVFIKEKIDLEALMLLTEDDLKSMGIEMGPRRKLLRAITDRKSAISQPGEVIDSAL